MKTTYKIQLIAFLFIIPIFFNSSCGVSSDKDLIALKDKMFVGGKTIGEYFNDIAGIGGIVVWENIKSDDENVKRYKVSITRSKSIHATDVDVTFIYDTNTQNIAVHEALFHGHPQTLSDLDACFSSLKLVMSSGWELTD